MPDGLLNGIQTSIAGDPIIDGMTNGYRWSLDDSRTVDWSISGGWLGEYWSNPTDIASRINSIFSIISLYANINFRYLGHYQNPALANSAGSDMNIAIDTISTFGSSRSVWGRGYFPIPNDPNRGDVYINGLSPANFLSYEPGSAGWALLVHEIGHALGLKHPHDDGGTGRPTLSSLGLGNFDIDIATVMSYKDGADWNLIQWDPATPMILDVLALQYLYGKNLTNAAGTSTHELSQAGYYTTGWDSSGTDTISLAKSTIGGWVIVLPSSSLSALIDTKVGFAVPKIDVLLNFATTFVWLAGDYENVKGSDYSDEITGNQFNNSIESLGGDDIILAGAGNDTINGGLGHDTITGGAGNDNINGGEGTNDVAKFSGKFSDYIISDLGFYNFYIEDKVDNRDGKDTLNGIEEFHFLDGAKKIADLLASNSKLRISPSHNTVSEGDTLVISIYIENNKNVLSFDYLITGISKEDLVVNNLSGTIFLNNGGYGQIELKVAEDTKIEGNEILNFTINNQVISVTVLDTSYSSTNSDGLLRGSDNNDKISGNNSAETIYGYDGDDLITKSTDYVNNDFIYGGDGNDLIQAGGGIDTVYGGFGQDEIWLISIRGGRFYGDSGNDKFVFDLSKSSDVDAYVDGGAGLDVASLSYSLYSISLIERNNLEVSLVWGNRRINLFNIERLEDTRTGLAFDLDASAGQAFRIYRAAFDRSPDKTGLGYWMKQMDKGMDVVEVAARFIDSPEFRQLYGSNVSNSTFITNVYNNVLDRDPDDAGLTWWVNEMKTNPSKSWQKVLADFSESAENKANVATLIADGITYQPWVG